jgi:hypothetical protein
MSGSAPVASSSTTPSGFSSNAASITSAAGSLSSGISSIGAAYGQSKAYEIQAQFQSNMNKMNAEVADLQAEDAIDRGKKAVGDHKKAVKGLIGEERANLAAQGIALDSGSALDVQTTTATLGALDELTIKNNAAREAFGYREASITGNSAASFASIMGKEQAQSTLLTGGLNAINYGIKGASAFK